MLKAGIAASAAARWAAALLDQDLRGEESQAVRLQTILPQHLPCHLLGCRTSASLQSHFQGVAISKTGSRPP